MDQEAATGLWSSYDGWITQTLDALQGTGWLGWFIGMLLEAPYNILFALTHPGMWLDFSDKQAVMRLVYFGGSKELFFAFLFIFLVVTAIGLMHRGFMWGCVRSFEGMTNFIGRTAAWAGLLMVMQQVMIVFLQRVFAVSEISIGFGISMTHDVSWWAEELKLFNAMIVALCVGYTFVQGGHVRVDLVYAPISYRAKKIVDMIGSMIFMVPAAVLLWMYSWFFLWRHLIVPKPAASLTYEKLMLKARALRWNIETVGFSPNGFNAYFLFKILLVVFTGLVFLQAVTFFYRSYLELREGPESDGKYLDRDELEPAEAAMHSSEHLA